MSNVVDKMFTLSEQMDDQINFLRSHHEVAYESKNLFGQVVSNVFSGFKQIPRWFKDASSIDWTIVPVLLGLVGIPGGISLNFWTAWPTGYIISGSSFIIFIGLMLTVKKVLDGMCRLNHHLFDMRAYRKFKREEYDLLKPLFSTDTTFNSLGLQLIQWREGNEETASTVELLIDDKTNQIHTLKEEHLAQIQKLEASNNALLSELDLLDEEVKDTELVITYLYEVLNEISIILYAIHNKTFDYPHLKMFCGFTIYKETDYSFIKLQDIGTTGVSADELRFDEPFYQHYAMFKARSDQSKAPKYNLVSSEESKYVVSYRMKMGKGTHSDIWYLNFHFDRDIQFKAWHLTIDNDIIDNIQVYRLFHALCLILKSEEGEVTSDGKNT